MKDKDWSREQLRCMSFLLKLYSGHDLHLVHHAVAFRDAVAV
jgi:hypothetical protein